MSIDMIIQNVSKDGFTDISFTCPGSELERAKETIEEIVPQIDARTYDIDEDNCKS